MPPNNGIIRNFSPSQIADFYRAVVPDLPQHGNHHWRSACPMHGGVRDSFAVEADTGKWFCHSNCRRGGDIYDLYQLVHGCTFLEARRAIEDMLLGITSMNGRDKSQDIEYLYRDENRLPVLRVVRTPEKKFVQYRPDEAGGWTPGITDKTTRKLLVRLLPYNLPGLLASTGRIYILEGEKDVRNLYQMKLTATCNPMGAGKWNRLERGILPKVFRGRDVVILPDNDASGREHAIQVAASLRGIARSIKWLELPDLPEKGDVSDWIAAGGTRDALEQLADSAPESIPPPREKRQAEGGAPVLPSSVDEMLQNYVILVGSDMIWDERRGRTTNQAEVKLAHANEYTTWVKSDNTRKMDIEKLVFSPQGCAADEINLFRGLQMKPDLTRPCQRLIDHIAFICSGDPGLIHWLTCWLAFPLQHLGIKMHTAVVVHGPQGTGKSILFEPIVKIYAPYADIIGQAEIESPYTGWASQKLFVLADEVLGRAERSQARNRLKSLITSETIGIEEKYRQRRVESNHMNLVFLSNEDTPVIVEPGDRRYTVIEVDTIQPLGYYEAIAAEIEQGGAQGLMAYLMAYDTEGFSAADPPYETRAKATLAEICASPTDQFLDEWLAEELPLPVLSCTVKDLYEGFQIWCKFAGIRIPENQVRFGRTLGKRFPSQKRVQRLGNSSPMCLCWHGEWNPADAIHFREVEDQYLKLYQGRKL